MSAHRCAATTPRLTTLPGEGRCAGRNSPGRTGRRGLLRAVAVIAAMATALVGCAAAGASSGSSSGPLTIGMSLPLTGPAADVAKSGYQGYQLWAAQVNANGGLLGRKVALNVLDDGFDPNQTGTDYTRLISQEKVDLLLGTFSSLLNAPASAIAARQRMLYVEPSGGTASLFTRGFTNLFFAQPGTTETLPNLFIQWFSSLPSDQRPKTAAYLTQDDPSASPAVEIFKSRLQALGVTKVYDQSYDPSTSNFDSIAASVVRSQPQMIIQGAVGNDGAAFVRSLEKLDFSPKIFFQTNSPADDTYPDTVGMRNTEGVFSSEAWSPTASYGGNADFVSTYTQMFGSPPTEDAANSYTAGQVLAAAVRAVGRVDQNALADWLHANTVNTIVGPLKWGSTGVPVGDGLLAQWQNGTLQVIAPKSTATSDTVVYPKPGWSN